MKKTSKHIHSMFFVTVIIWAISSSTFAQESGSAITSSTSLGNSDKLPIPQESGKPSLTK